MQSLMANAEPLYDVELFDSALPGMRHGTVRLEEKVGQLFETLRYPVYRYLVTTFGNPAQAEEIIQDAFLILYRQLHGGQSIENTRAWIFRVAHNLALDQLERDEGLTQVDGPTWDEISESMRDPGLNPEQALLQQEKYARVHGALGSLSPQQRRCLHLRAEGFRYREIAEILGIDTSSVAEFLRRGIKRLMVQNNG